MELDSVPDPGPAFNPNHVGGGGELVGQKVEMAQNSPPPLQPQFRSK